MLSTLPPTLLALSLTCTLATAQSPWPATRHDNQRTATSPLVASQSAETLYPEKISASGFTIIDDPVVGFDGTVFYNAFHGVYAIDPLTGANLFSLSNAGDYTTVGPDGRLYVASGSLGDTVTHGWVKAYQPNGTLDWTFTMPTAGGPLAPVTVAPDGTIYGSTMIYLTPTVPVQENSAIFALNANGNLLWNSAIGGQPSRRPMALSEDGKLFETSGNQKLNRIDTSDGSTVWSMPPAGANQRILGAPLITQSIVIVTRTTGIPVANQAHLAAYDAETGALAWEVPFNSSLGVYSLSGAYPAPALLANGDVLAFWDRMYRVSPTGGLVSSMPFPAPMNELSHPVTAADDTVYTWTASSQLLAFSAGTGVAKFQFNPIAGCREAVAPTILGDGSIFLAWRRRTTCEVFAATTRFTTLVPPDVAPCECSSNLAPVALIAGDPIVPPNDPVVLDGTGSADPERGPLQFEWREILVGGGLGPILSTEPTVTVFPNQDQTKTYQLTVADCCGAVDVDSFQQTSQPDGIIVQPVAGELLTIGQVYSILWVPDTFPTNRVIQISRDAGPFETIALNVPNSGFYNWLVSGPATQDAVLRIFPVGAPTFAEISETFRIGICQADLGFGGPGSLTLALCGDPLESGGVAELAICGAPALAPTWVVLGSGMLPTPVLGGVLVPSPPSVLYLGSADAVGELVLGPIQGGQGPLTLYLQAACLDLSLPEFVALSNAVQAEFLP